MLWQVATRNSTKPLEVISMEELDELQDANWAEFDDREQAKGEDFAAFVEPLIEAYPEPEVLHYITDVFTEDEGDEFSIEPTAKLPMFVMLKTVADALFLD